MIDQIISHKNSLFMVRDGELFEYIPLMQRLGAEELEERLASELSQKQLQSSDWSFTRFVWVRVTTEVYQQEERLEERTKRREIPNRE